MRRPHPALLLVFWLCGSAGARASDFEFRKIADSDTIAPGAVSDFALFGAPAIDGETVAFAALAAGAGVYLWRDDELAQVAHVSVPVPGRLDDFRDFAAPTLAGDEVAFAGASARFPSEGVYRATAGGLERVAGITSRPPGGASAFLGFGRAWLGPEALTFAAVTARPEPGDAIFVESGGELELVVEQGDGVPESGDRFQTLSDPVLDGERILFRGSGFEGAGVYAVREGRVRPVASTQTLVPAARETFEGFEFLSAGGGGVAFVGRSPTRRGVYLDFGGELTVVADGRTPIPGGRGRFTGFGDVAVDGRRVAFVGRGTELQEGIYARLGGRAPVPVVARGDTLDGRRVTFLELGPQGLSADRIVLRAGFDDASEGVFMATTP